VSGHTFSPRRIAEIVPHRIYALSGFEFTEYYFVVSDDGQQLIGIDAGTRPDSAKDAYEALRAYAPELPELTTIFITHSHWDHIGGHAFFRGLNPRLRTYARSNYQEEIAHDLEAPVVFAKSFFGERFNVEDVRSFKPDVLVDRRTELTVGGTPIELIPVEGGETHDALFINLPGLGALFVGDFIMPYLGAPFVPEGDLQGLLDAIDIVVQTQPKHLLHGHEPLTRNFASSSMLAQLKTDLIWLRAQALVAIRRGDERALIHEANLTPPGLLHGTPDAYLPYLLLREHVIDRLFDQNVGYWQADLQGVDHLGRADRAALLVDYLGLSERQVVAAIDRLMADGKYELAASLLDSCRSRFAHSEPVAKAERLVYLKLMEKYQDTDPFKFILYSAKVGEQVPQMREPPASAREPLTIRASADMACGLATQLPVAGLLHKFAIGQTFEKGDQVSALGSRQCEWSNPCVAARFLADSGVGSTDAIRSVAATAAARVVIEHVIEAQQAAIVHVGRR
jgi:glyoxylase-like metal-dependent hydrolase (beta-lactamase superfamily II)